MKESKYLTRGGYYEGKQIFWRRKAIMREIKYFSKGDYFEGKQIFAKASNY